MGSMKQFEIKIKSLLDVIDLTEAQQVRVVVSAISWMAIEPPTSNLAIWSKDATEQTALHRLTTKWLVDDSELPMPMYNDYADIVFLLARAKLDFFISDAMRVNLSNPLFKEELRYAGLVVAAAQQDRAILYRLLNLNLNFTELALEVLNAAMYAHHVSGKLNTALPLDDDRCAVQYILANVHLALKHFPIKQMLPQPNSALVLKGVRYCTVIALASAAIRHINR